jgi:hypothetical protein
MRAQKEGMMLKNRLRTYLLIFLSCLCVSACAQLGLQSKKETAEPVAPIPECKKNYTKEGIPIFGRMYKTWVKYDHLDFKRGFDAAVTAIKARGGRAIFVDRDSGTIKAEMAFEAEKQTYHPVEIKLVKEKTSLIIHFSSKAAGGSSGPAKLCIFYEEFEKLTKRGPTASQPKQTTAPLKKPAEPAKESAPAVPPVASPRPSPYRTTPPPPKALLPHAEVKWALVNLREGPGTNYKVIGKATKGTSLEILEEKRGWLHVRLEDGKEAWISKTATSSGAKTPPSMTPPPSRAPSQEPGAQKPKSPM